MNVSSPPETVASSATSYDVTLASFKSDVLEASRTALVLGVFWTGADEAGKHLIGVLEKVARERQGSLRVAKIDIHRNGTIAQQMGIQQVPSVYAFFQGRPVEGFAGNIPEAQLKAWIDRLTKAVGLQGEEKPNLDAAFAQADECLAEGDRATARAIYMDILDMEPENAKAYAALARCLLDDGEMDKAKGMVDNAPASIAKGSALDGIRAALELAEQAKQGAGAVAELEAAVAQNPDNHEARLDLAMAYYAAGRNEVAIDQLLDIVRRDRTWNDAAGRKQLVKIFDALGPTHALTITSRRRLSSILFS